MIYKTCPHCGANLDPGESCDCQSKKIEPPCTTRNGSNETSYAQSIQAQRAFVKSQEVNVHGQ